MKTLYNKLSMYQLKENELKRRQREFLCKKIAKCNKRNKKLIILGDLNSMQNEVLDRWSNIPRTTVVNVRFMQEILEKGVIDTFRFLNEDKRSLQELQ